MQKKLIALAVAGLASGAAFAQSNVTIYGVADVGVNYANAANGGHFGIESGTSAGSRLGFKGEEGLGNGLKAIWVAEMGLDFMTGQATCHSISDSRCGTSLGNGTQSGTYLPPTNQANATNNTTGSTLFTRQIFAGLSSDTLGTATIGRQYTPATAVMTKADPFGLGTAATAANLWYSTNAYYFFRVDRALNYASPTFAGFKVNAMYSTGLQNNTNSSSQVGAAPENAGRYASASVNYTGYGLDVGVAAHHINLPVYGATVNNDVTTLPASASEPSINRAYVIGGNYDFGVAKLYASWVNSKTADYKATANGGLSENTDIYDIGVKVPFGAHSVMAQIGHMKNKAAPAGENKQATDWGLGYEYAMSKRTALYAAYGHMSNTANSNFGLIGTATNNGLAMVNNLGAAINGGSAYEFDLGMRHSF